MCICTQKQPRRRWSSISVQPPGASLGFAVRLWANRQQIGECLTGKKDLRAGRILETARRPMLPGNRSMKTCCHEIGCQPDASLFLCAEFPLLTFMHFGRFSYSNFNKSLHSWYHKVLIRSFCKVLNVLASNPWAIRDIRPGPGILSVPSPGRVVQYRNGWWFTHGGSDALFPGHNLKDSWNI